MLDLTQKRIVVTGGNGFLGRHLVRALKARGCWNVLVPLPHHFDLVRAEDVKRLFRDLRPDVVFHLAARCGGIGANRDAPGRFLYDNLMMGLQVMDEARLTGVEKLITVGTVCSYPKHTPAPFREESLWDGYPEETNAPYGLAKKMLLVQSQAYRAQYGFNSVVLFPANLYGPGDNFDPQTSHVIPALIRKIDGAIRRGETEVTIWGDGTPTREFLYVDDCAEALCLAAERYDESDPVNVGTGFEISIRDLAFMLGTLMGYEGAYVFDESKPNGQPRRCLDTTRARERFGFEARMPLEDGLRKTIDWWRTCGGQV